MGDPASLNVTIEVSGMDGIEASAALSSLRPGSSVTFAVTQPALGGPRYRLSAAGLSIGAVGDLMTNIAINHSAAALGVQEGDGDG